MLKVLIFAWAFFRPRPLPSLSVAVDALDGSTPTRLRLFGPNLASRCEAEVAAAVCAAPRLARGAALSLRLCGALRGLPAARGTSRGGGRGRGLTLPGELSGGAPKSGGTLSTDV